MVQENRFEKLREKSEKVDKARKLSAAKAEKVSMMNWQGEWEPIVITVDSGAGNNVAPRNAFPWARLEPNDDSRAGRYYTTANGTKVYVLGEKTIVIRTIEGILKKMKFHIADVSRILASVGKIMEAGNDSIMSLKGSRIVDERGEAISMEMENGVFVIRCHAKVEEASVFTRPAL